MQPVVDRLSDTYSDQVAFVALDANEDDLEAFRATRLPGHPSFIVLLPNGQEVWRGFGLVEEADLESAIREALQQS